MIRSLLFILFLAFICSCEYTTQNGEGAVEALEQEMPSDGVFIHISHGADDPHRVVMGLSMALKMSEDKDVLVYFDIKGIEVVLNDAEEITHPTFPTSGEMLEKLIGKGVPLFACPGCLKAAGKTGEDLMEGVKVAEKEKFFNFTKGRILTIDY